MTALLLLWLQFLVCALLIGFAGNALIKYGEELAEITGISRGWIGLVLIAAATSLPELLTGLSAITLADTPDIAVGNALGACVLNLALLVLLDALTRDESVYSRINQHHTLAASFGILLLGVVGMMIIVAQAGFVITLGHIGAFAPLIVVLYLVAMRATYLQERTSAQVTRQDAFPPTGYGLRTVVTRYAAAALVVVVVGGYLPFLGTQIAKGYGWADGFVGTVFITLITSLPEAAVTLAALRRHAFDLAIANLLGSNLFAMVIIAVDDIAYTKGHLLAAISPVHAASAFAGMIMTAIFMIALLYQPRNRFFGMLGWISLALLAVYLFSVYFIYLHG